MLKEQFGIESMCVPEANDDVRVCSCLHVSLLVSVTRCIVQCVCEKKKKF